MVDEPADLGWSDASPLREPEFSAKCQRSGFQVRLLLLAMLLLAPFLNMKEL
jgi:hypothetical protein